MSVAQSSCQRHTKLFFTTKFQPDSKGLGTRLDMKGLKSATIHDCCRPNTDQSILCSGV